VTIPQGDMVKEEVKWEKMVTEKSPDNVEIKEDRNVLDT
jgi:hypothetical protein